MNVIELEGSVRIVSVGRLIQSKRFDVVLQAMSHLPGNVHLHVLGDGPMRAKLAGFAESLGISDRVHWHGAVKNVYSYLRAADFFVTATEYEGQPNAVLEAMACGVPVVASSIPPISEIGEDGVHFRLVDGWSPDAYAAVILELMQDAEKRSFISNNGIDKVADDFGVSAVKQRWLKLVDMEKC